jgi:myo-inositol-1(or 4)-monophosphatase
MLEKILEFVKEAGNYAKANQVNVDFASSKMKSARVHDVVTETDFEVSRRFKKFVETEFLDLDYVIVDEETIANLGPTPMREIKRHEYAFIIDPIDGTLTYANGLPFWGVSVGVFRNQKSIASVIYVPGLDLLAYADEKNGFIEENNTKCPLKKLSETAAFYANTRFSQEDTKQRESMNMAQLNIYSAAGNSLYMIVGKLRGWTSQACLWDIAGAYGVFAHTGVKIFDTTINQPINLFDENLFNEELRLKTPKIVCLPKYYQDFKKLYKV